MTKDRFYTIIFYLVLFGLLIGIPIYFTFINPEPRPRTTPEQRQLECIKQCIAPPGNPG